MKQLGCHGVVGFMSGFLFKEYLPKPGWDRQFPENVIVNWSWLDTWEGRER